MVLANNFSLLIKNSLNYGVMIKDHFIKLSYDISDYGFYIGLMGLNMFYLAAYYHI